MLRVKLVTGDLQGQQQRTQAMHHLVGRKIDLTECAKLGLATKCKWLLFFGEGRDDEGIENISNMVRNTHPQFEEVEVSEVLRIIQSEPVLSDSEVQRQLTLIRSNTPISPHTNNSDQMHPNRTISINVDTASQQVRITRGSEEFIANGMFITLLFTLARNVGWTGGRHFFMEQGGQDLFMIGDGGVLSARDGEALWREIEPRIPLLENMGDEDVTAFIDAARFISKGEVRIEPIH